MSSSPETPVPSEKSPLAKTLLKVGAGLAVLVALFLLGRQATGYVDGFTAWVDGLGFWGPVVFVLGYAVATVAFIPGSALTLAAGAIFGLWEGTLYAFLGATLGATAAFLVARYVARSWVESKLESYPRFGRIDRAVGEDGGKLVALLRLAPIFPFNLLNYALGLTSVRLVPYVLASLAMVPGTLMYVYFGAIGRDVASAGERTPMEWGLLVLGLAAVVAATTIITKKARKALDQTIEEKGETRDEH